MTIKITELNLFNNKGEVLGELGLSFTQGDVNGYTAHDFTKLSPQVKKQFNSVLKLIEDELNGVKVDSTAKLHTGEKVLNKSEVDKILNQAYDLSKGVLAGSNIFVDSQKSAEDFTKGITEILDLYSEFAKMGNKKDSKKDYDLSADLY